jgi:hypothetical protein
MYSRLIIAIGCAITVCSIGQAQFASTPLERAEFKKTTSHEQMVQYLQELKSASSRFALEDIGKTVQGRSIPMIHVLPTGSEGRTKVLLFCQQHGNEPSGKEAALLLLNEIARGEVEAILSHLDLTIIPCVNPDGNEAGKRANASGEDLNRNHLLLTQPEVVAVHTAFNRLQPEVTLDVHEYSAYRKEFTSAGYVRSVDEQFGAPTNLNVSPTIRKYAMDVLFPFLDTRLKKRGVTFSNYLKMNAPSDTVRPSTTSIDDGRQSFAIRNRFSFIVEGKGGRGMNDELQRRSAGQLAAIESFLEFVNLHSREIKTMVGAETKKIARSKEPVVVKMDYLYKQEKTNLPVVDLKSGRDSAVSVAIAPKASPLESVQRPQAYVIPKEQKEIIALLQKHDIKYVTVVEAKQQVVEQYSIVDVQQSWMENKPTWMISSRVQNVKTTLRTGDVIVPLNQESGTMIAIALEPSSMWGLVQEDEFSALRTKGSDYPIYRIATRAGGRR